MSLRKPYSAGVYSTILLEDYKEENQLIFKLQQRKLNKIRSIAEHVMTQVSPSWKEQKLDEDITLRKEIASCFKLLGDCRLLSDLTLYRVSAEKKVQVHVQSIRNLDVKGTRN